jgi:ketosteroid isomerase-like protein
MFMSQPSLRVVSGLPAIRERLTRLYAARARGDVATFAAGFAREGTFHILGDQRLMPEAGKHCGRPAIEATLESLKHNYEAIDGLLVDLIVDLNAAMVRRHATLRSPVTGAVAEFEIAEHLRLANGEIVELVQFIDTVAIAVLSGRM